MSQYATLKDLIERTDGNEVVQRGVSSLLLNYRQSAATAANLVDTISGPVVDDAVLAEDDGLLYRFDGQSWAAIATPKIDRALTDASTIVDDYLRGRYALPLPGIPRSIVLHVCDIARYFLYDDAATEQVAERYKAAITWLKSVAAGTVVLDSTEAPLPEQSKGSANITGPGRVFSRDTMEDF